MGRVQSKRRKVLIVEDDAEIRLLMKMVLENSEFDIIECQSAEMALAKNFWSTVQKDFCNKICQDRTQRSKEYLHAGG